MIKMKKVICLKDATIAPSLFPIYKDKIYYIRIFDNGLCGVYEEYGKREGLGVCPETYFKDIAIFRDERINEILDDEV